MKPTGSAKFKFRPVIGNGRDQMITMEARQSLERQVAAGYASGLVALIGRGDDAQVMAIGDQAIGGPPMARDTLFRIASITKPIAAAAAMILVEDGKLSLDEPVDRLLPELADRQVLRRLDGPLDDTVPARRPITLDDLLTFRLGLGVLFAPPGAWPIQRAIADMGMDPAFGPPDPTLPFAPDEWMSRLGRLPLFAQPGEAWMYTTGSAILGVLIARASGQSLPDFLQARLFGPLGMKDTAFHVPPDRLRRLAAAYLPAEQGLVLRDDPAHSRWALPPAFPSADAGLVSTADDLFAFSRFLLDRGRVDGRRLLGEASVSAMTADQLTRPQRESGGLILGDSHGWGYGMAVAIRTTPEGIPDGAFGWNGGAGTSWVADPASGTTAILLTQTMFVSPDPPAAHKGFWRAVFGGGRAETLAP